ENARDLDLAINDFNRALAIDPEFILALNNRANAYRMKGDLNAAESDLNGVLTKDPNLVSALLNRCVVRASQGRFEVGKTDCDRAERLAPKSLVVLTSVGMADLMSGQFQGAISYFNAALAIDPRHARSLY